MLEKKTDLFFLSILLFSNFVQCQQRKVMFKGTSRSVSTFLNLNKQKESISWSPHGKAPSQALLDFGDDPPLVRELGVGTWIPSAFAS